MSRLPFIRDDDEDAAKKPFVPPHKMLDESVSHLFLSFCSLCIAVILSCVLPLQSAKINAIMTTAHLYKP